MDRRNCTADWERRIARARALALEHPSAGEVLTFYAELAEYQQSLSAGVPVCREASRFADTIDIASAADAVPDFLVWLQTTAPPPLAEAAHVLHRERCDWQHRLHDCLTRDDAGDAAGDEGALDEAMAFIGEAVLQPYAEAAALDRAASRGSGRSHSMTPRCPVCSAAPTIGSLREEGHGAKRALLCGRCLTEWEYLRVVCPSCDEQRFDALPVYTANAWPYVRIDACDTCRTYLKTIDLTRNGLAVPLVDDLASVALDLWAGEHGYRRLRPNLLRTSQPAAHRPVA